jgi:hypothetical protein
MRDFGWLVQCWDVGCEARRRSRHAYSLQFNKEFYFRFGLSYINYLLAGQNTLDRCLVGLHGNIYDLTQFLSLHPGSPDTVMVHAGRDATEFFEDMRHSMGARRMAQSLCVVVNSSILVDDCYGARPTSKTTGIGPLPQAVNIEKIPLDRRKSTHRIMGNLHSLKTIFLLEQAQTQRAVERRFASNANVLSHVNTYYDPFDRRWKAWYTNAAFQATFVDDV